MSGRSSPGLAPKGSGMSTDKDRFWWNFAFIDKVLSGAGDRTLLVECSHSVHGRGPGTGTQHQINWI